MTLYHYNGKEWIEIAKNGRDGDDGEPGKPADEQKIVNEVLSKIPKPEPKEINGKEVVKKIEELEDDDRLSYDALKDTPFIPHPSSRDFNFTELKDTPSTYEGQGGKAVRVSADSKNLEFANFPTGNTGDVVGPALSVHDQFSLFSGITGKVLKMSVLRQLFESGFYGIGGIDFIQFGISPAQTGAFRLSPENKIVSRDGFDSMDIDMLYLDIYDNIVFANLLYFNIYTGIASFGFPDSSVPGLKPNGAVLEVKLGDDSGYANAKVEYIETEKGLIMKQLSSTPSSPSAGSNKLYFKTDGNLYKLNSSGVETLIG